MDPSTSPPETEQDALDQLGEQFMQAVQLKSRGEVDAAEDVLREILKTEPRLAEPHMELARILLDTGRRQEAEDHAREAVQHLQQGDTWTQDIPEHIVRGLAHATLAEVLRQRADEDDVIFGDPETFHALVAESKQHFNEAARLDPSDEYASYHAFFLGPS